MSVTEYEILKKVLIDKGIIDEEDLREAYEKVKQERYEELEEMSHRHN